MGHLTDEQIRNIHQVISWLESPEAQEEFDMTVWFSPCETAMCIGGFIEERIMGMMGSYALVAEQIGVPEDKAKYVFATDIWSHLQSQIDPKMAIQFLQNWRDHAVLDWESLL